MHLLLHLESIVSDFRLMFNSQNFVLFQVFLFGFMAQPPQGSLTDLYQSSGAQTRYWSFPKFLSRAKWNADAVAVVLIRRIQGLFEQWVYVHDATQVPKDGKNPMGFSFFPQLQYIRSISEHDITLPFAKAPLETYNIVQTLVGLDSGLKKRWQYRFFVSPLETPFNEIVSISQSSFREWPKKP